MEAASNGKPPPASIFSLHSASAQNWILLGAASLSFLTPTTDTIILPALVSVGSALPGATPDTAAATVSAYMACLGICNLVWGPLSDYAGRRRPLFLSLALYLILTVACIFAPTAQALIALRAAEGAVTGATISITQGIVSDVFAPARRGTALGLFFVPLLVGPILAPVIGGLLTTAMDWRAVFIFCAALSAPMLAIVCVLPETQHWHLLRQRRHQQLQQLARTSEAAALPLTAEELAGEVPLPRMTAPWTPLVYLLDCSLAPHTLLAAVVFGSLFVSLTVFPGLLAAAPFNFSPAVVGACYLPIGTLMMAGSVLGGRLSDAAAAAHPRRPSARLVPSLLGACCMPAGCLVFGWGAWAAQARGGSLAVVLVGHVLVGIGQASYGPGFFAFVTATKQRNAAGAAGAALAVSFAVAGAFISAAVPIQAALGIGALFSIVAGVNVAAIAWAVADIAFRRRSPDAAAAAACAPAALATAAAVAEDGGKQLIQSEGESVASIAVAAPAIDAGHVDAGTRVDEGAAASADLDRAPPAAAGGGDVRCAAAGATIAADKVSAGSANPLSATLSSPALTPIADPVGARHH